MREIDDLDSNRLLLIVNDQRKSRRKGGKLLFGVFPRHALHQSLETRMVAKTFEVRVVLDRLSGQKTTVDGPFECIERLCWLAQDDQITGGVVDD